MPMTRQAALSRMPDSRMVRPTSGVSASMVNCSKLTSGGRCCSSSCFRFSTRFSTNSRKTLISLSVAATMMWSKGYRRSSPPGMFMRSSPRMIVTTLTPQVWRKFNSFSVLPTLGEDCDTSKSARWRSRSSKCLTKRCLMGDLRSCSFWRAVKLRRKRRSSCMEYFFNRLE